MCFKKKKAAPVEEPVTEAAEEETVDTGAEIGKTSVSYSSLVKDPKDAVSDQEKLAQEELRRKRIERARSKQSLLRKRLERMQDYGSGKKVLTGNERDLGKMASSSLIAPATGKRSGSGRRSLLTGSRGGIGFYSRYL